MLNMFVDKDYSNKTTETAYFNSYDAVTTIWRINIDNLGIDNVFTVNYCTGLVHIDTKAFRCNGFYEIYEFSTDTTDAKD